MYRDPYPDYRRSQDEFDKKTKRMGIVLWTAVIFALVFLAWQVWG